MLSGLHIRNFALIKSLDQVIKPGFTVVTGETGAGKSILLGALQLALGGRADLKSLALGGEKCVVEADFILDKKKWEQRFISEDWDFLELNTLRREISSSGKSRAFINDSPVRLDDLKRLSEELIDIHSQRNGAFLSDPRFIADFLDSFGNLNSFRESYLSVYKEFKELELRMAKLKDDFGVKFDPSYISFVMEEVDLANFDPTEEEELRAELKLLSGSQDIQILLKEIRQKTEMSSGLNDGITEWVGALDKLNRQSSIFDSVREDAGSIQDLFQSVTHQLELFLEKIEPNPERQFDIEGRLNLIDQLLRKHRVNSLEDLLVLRSNWKVQLDSYDEGNDYRKELEKGLNIIKLKLGKAANKVHEERLKLFSGIEISVKSSLADLNMENTMFSIIYESIVSPESYGMHRYTLLFSANSGQEMQPVEKVASGGESNRLMLALKSLFVQGKDLETILFDEIDSGVSGSTAAKVADMFREMGKYSQVIAITHLPQVGAAGSSHWRVEKNSKNGGTQTDLLTLSKKDRVFEVARLLTGKKITETALAQAKFLLKN